MEILLNSLIGFLVVPLYNTIKRGLGITGVTAAWILVLLVLLIAVPMALATGQLTGLAFDLGNPCKIIEEL